MKNILWLLPASIAFATVSSAQTRPTVTLTIVQPTVIEGQGSGGVLMVRRSQATENSLRVFYRLSGSARNGVDYERLPGSVEIPAGREDATIEIIPRDDNRREPTERVVVQLRPAPRNSPQYRLGASRAQAIRIVDNDQPVGPRPPPVGQLPTWFPLPGGLVTIPTNAPPPPNP